MSFQRIQFMGIFLSLLLLLQGAPQAEKTGETSGKLQAKPERIERRIKELAEYGKTPEGGVNRVAFSDEDKQAREYIIIQMKEAGLEVRIDTAGNIIGCKEGTQPHFPPIMSGSHIDTVPNGGKFDGAVGVISALECAHVLNENKIPIRHPLEVVVFTDEEGGLTGSRSMIGKITPATLEVMSLSGKTIRQGIIALGGNPDELAKAARKKGDIKAFIEIHVEQGGILETKNLDIGVVEGIVGIKRWDVTIEGYANHAGTTPMDMRKDALIAASHLILAVNRIVTGMPGRQVGTVGRIKAEPGAPNVIPGKVIMSLELRDLSEEKIDAHFEKISAEAQKIAKDTDTTITITPLAITAFPAPTDPRMRRIISEATEEWDLRYLLMPSGAGHDAQDMARITPMGMIFVPSVGGVSHSPKEYTYLKDIVNGANILLTTILKIDKGALD